MEPHNTNENDKPNESQESDEPNTSRKGASIDDDLAKELNEHHRALMTEFELANKGLGPNPTQADLKEFFLGKIHNAAATVAWLSINAHSEGVRLNASKYIIQEAFAEGESGALEEILKSLKATKVNAASN